MIPRPLRRGLATAIAAAIGVVCLLAGAERKSIPNTVYEGSVESRLRRDVEQLASPEFGGRALGSEGADRAAAYIEARFRELKLDASPGAGYRQHFPVRLNVKIPGQKKQNALRLASPTSSTDLELHKDYLPLPFSGNGRVGNAPIVFAGYAIHAPELQYDDFANVDVRGKVVIAFRREPKEEDENSPFAGRDFTSHASFAAKASQVMRRGGKALLLVTNRLPAEEDHQLPALATSAGPEELPIPVILVRTGALLPFFTEQGISLSTLAGEIDHGGNPKSMAFPNGYSASVSVRIDSVQTRGRNVLAWVPGHPDCKEYVIVAAHYDHVGLGEKYSMDNGGKGKLHPGADDNASGVAALLELARTLAAERQKPLPQGTRGVLLAAFGGEEHGLFGSAYLLKHPVVPGGTLVGVLNFDMVGRLRDGELFQAGLESVPELTDVVEHAAAQTGLTLKPLREYPYNMSDHGTFLDAGIPGLLLFTGLHLEYHTPRDTPDRVDTTGIAKVLEVAGEVLREMRNAERPLRYTGGKNPAYERKRTEQVSPGNAYEYE